MSTDNLSISVIFTARDRLSSAVNSMKRSLGGFKAETEQVTKTTGFMRDTLSTMSGMLLRDVCRSFTATITESVRLGAQLDTLKNSFIALSKASGGYVPTLSELRTATRQMVSDTDLLKAANQALLLNIPTEDLGQLMMNAIKLGNAMGIDATSAINSLSTGVGRMSKLLLDNLGVVFEASDAYDFYAAKLGVATDELDENQRKTAWQEYAIKKINEKAEELGDNISEAQINQSRWNTSIENMKTALGKTIGPLGDFVNSLGDLLGPTIGVLISTTLPRLISKIRLTGSTAATSAIGVGSFFAGFLLAEEFLSGVPEELRGIYDALLLVVSGLVAATAAYFAFHGAMAGPAAPVVLGAMLASIGAAVVAVKDMLSMAEGGIVTKPTIALIGEAGPEAVVPLSKGGFGEPIQYVTVYPTINIASISKDFGLEDVHDAIVEGLGDGVNEYIAEKYRRRT